MKFKKILSAVISAAICCSFLPANISADEFDIQTSFTNSISLVDEKVSESGSIIGAFPDSFQLENAETDPIQFDGISFESEGGISTYSTSNSAPVAGLTVKVGNADSLLNGDATTETLLLWFWKYGGTTYTYDPDGDEITSYVVGGIYEYVIGTIKSGEEPVGFVTKITEAGPHNLSFYVTDSHGNKSNVVTATMTIEPADGNKRPKCVLKSTVAPYYTNSNVIFDWSDSYDEDSDDKITKARVRIYTDDGYEDVTTSSKYYMPSDLLNSTQVALHFDRAGTYTVGISVSDNQNAWSDWIGGPIEIVDRGSVTLLTLRDAEWKDSKTVRTKPTGSNSYVSHTLTTRLSGNIRVYKGTGGIYNIYRNYRGVYTNVAYDIIAPGAYFMSAETWVSSSNPNSYSDPYFHMETPRAITQEEIEILIANNKVNYIVYDPDTLEIIDFYSELNPIIAYTWSNIKTI